MLDSDDSAESVMSLDLSCRSDGLLVGFGVRSPVISPDSSERGQETALLTTSSSSSKRKAGWGRLFRRQSSCLNAEEKSLLQQSLNDDPQHYRDDDGDDYEGGYGLIRESPAPYHDRSSQQEEKDFDNPIGYNSNHSKFRDATNTKSSSYRDVTASGGRYPNGANKPPHWQNQSFSELPVRKGGGRGGMQGFGNCDPRRDASEGFGSFFKRLYDRQDDRQTMRIATEDTMEEPSWEKNIGRVAAVLLAPELCDDPDEDLDRLAMYRTIAPDDDDDEEDEGGDEKQEWNDSKPNEAALSKVEVQRLKVYVEKLERELKIRDMELMSWKQRAKELQEELRKVTGRGEEDSTEGHDSDEGGESDDEEEEDDDDDEVVDGDLLGLANENKAVDKDLPNRQAQSSVQHVESTQAGTDQFVPVPKGFLLLLDAEDATTSKPIVFDPLRAQGVQSPISTELALIPAV